MDTDNDAGAAAGGAAGGAAGAADGAAAADGRAGRRRLIRILLKGDYYMMHAQVELVGNDGLEM